MEIQAIKQPRLLSLLLMPTLLGICTLAMALLAPAALAATDKITSSTALVLNTPSQPIQKPHCWTWAYPP
jgi:hypothetical protein